MKGITAAALVSFAATMASAATITPRVAYPSDISGNPIRVALGESFYMTAKLHVDAPLNGTYRVRFDLPYATRTTPDLRFGGDATVVWGPYPALLDGPSPMKVSIQSNTDQPGRPFTVSIIPAAPAVGIEYFAPQNLDGSVSAQAKLSGGTLAGLQWFSPLPQTAGFQKVVTMSQHGSLATSAPFSQPVSSQAKIDTVSVQFIATASASCLNPGILRNVTFNAYANLPANVSQWLQPEALIESKSGEISAFVSNILPWNFRQTVRPYDAAQKLFQAVVAHVRYTTVTAKPDALTALRTGRGDCGYFSALFVAACRNIGIPARTVSGMTMGDNQWHVWAEFYLPANGWVPVDPTYCQTLCPDGSLPLYFATIPELNQRAAVTYGFDHSVNGYSMTMLQSPALFLSGSARVSSFQPFCHLAPVSSN